ncbi:MAG: type II secretion system protein [Betaproteobacteria bacterium]|nr:MAG: type II secretion system protein [Betaproteobacteria bacterium]TMH69762.1 MAG: type II secretion system protein [Betaproteobacteria bacterium]
MRSNFDMRTKESGFSLLEVLVAFVILSLVATALFRLFGGALGNAAAASEWSRALLVAQTRLAVAASALPLRESTDQGSETDGRVRWETKVAPYTPPNTTDDLERASEALPARLYRVSVDVRFPSDNGRDRVVSLSTLKLGARNPL